MKGKMNKMMTHASVFKPAMNAAATAATTMNVTSVFMFDRFLFSCFESRNSPQCLHFFASMRISSAQ